MEILRRLLITSVGRKMIMAATGLALGGFLLVHVIGNSSIFFGAAAFNAYAHHLHSLGPLIPVFEVVLLLVFICHVSFGALLFFSNRQARATRYVIQRSAGGRSLGSRTMFYTGLVILALIIYHLATVHFVDHDLPISAIIRQQFTQLPVAFFYCLALVALGLHLSHGLWSLWQSFGINHPLYNGILRGGAWFFALAISVVFIILPLLGLCWSGFLL